jgi:hypothetical protein
MLSGMRAALGGFGIVMDGAVLTGVDVQREPLALARRALEGCDYRLLLGDALLPRDAMWAALRPPGGFDVVAGNPPFVRHEAIRDPLGQLSPREYRASMATELRRRLPGVDLGGRADLALPFTLLGLSLLAPHGVLAFVLPTALFQAAYHSSLTDALALLQRSALFIESDAPRSFNEAVNTGIFLVRPSGVGSAGTIDQRRIKAPLHQVDPLVLGASATDGRPRYTISPRYPTLPLAGFGTVRYPVKTGLNRFFYPDHETIAHFGIEPQFLRPALKSPRAVRRIAHHIDESDVRLFVCDLTEEHLETPAGAGALRYVRWGAAQRSAANVPFPLVPSRRGRHPWYAIALPRPADLLIPRFVDRRFFVVAPQEAVIEDQTFYGLIVADPTQRDLLSAVLNSCLGHHALETHGRAGLGEGVRQYALGDAAALPIPDIRCIAPEDAAAIVTRYRPIAMRPLLPLPDELQLPDRLALDLAVGAAFALDDGAILATRTGTLDLLTRRLARAGR